MMRFRRPRDEDNPPTEPEQEAVEPTFMSERHDPLAVKLDALSDELVALREEIARNSKEQFKTNALTKRALEREVTPPPTQTLSRSSSRRSSDNSTLRILEALMPVLDGIEAGITSGKAQLARIHDPEARQLMEGWLDGQRLLRERLLALFDRENVRPIPTMGQPFDPYRHVAVETVIDATRAKGTIIAERLRGYEVGQRVLRFAQVVVTSN